MTIKKHSNRKKHNWLIYDISDRFLNKNTAVFKGTIYDLGCGQKPYEDFFLQFSEKYVGIDWSSSLHDLKADIIANLNEPLPVDSSVADTLVSFSVIEHIREPQIMLSEAFRILKPGGQIMLLAPWQWWIHEAPYDYFRYTPYGLQYLFDKAGFKEIKIEPLAGFFSMIFLKINYFLYRYSKNKSYKGFLVKIISIPIWYLGQILAPHLDKFDKNWALEATGYAVIARKGSP